MIFQREIHLFLQFVVESLFSSLSFVLSFLTPILIPIFDVFIQSTGVEINGSNPWDIKVKDKRFYGMAAAKGVTGFCDAYINGYIDCDDLQNFCFKLLEKNVTLFKIEKYHPYRLLKYCIHKYFDILTPAYIMQSINLHYDKHANNIKYTSDSTSHYSAMLLNDIDEIEQASIDRLDELMTEATLRTRENIAEKLKLQPGMNVLDIGCGFGGLAKHLAEKYKVNVTGVTISKDMAKEARIACKGLPVKIIHNDYRSVTGQFDRIVSIEMFEHVGENHHREYFEKVYSLLAKDGIFVFQCHHVAYECHFSYSPLFEKSLEMYCYFPRIQEITAAVRSLFLVEDVQNLGFCFGVTVKAMMKKQRWNKEMIYKDASEIEFRRSWIYGCFAYGGGLTGKDRVYQYVFSKE